VNYVNPREGTRRPLSSLVLFGLPPAPEPPDEALERTLALLRDLQQWAEDYGERPDPSHDPLDIFPDLHLTGRRLA